MAPVPLAGGGQLHDRPEPDQRITKGELSRAFIDTHQP